MSDLITKWRNNNIIFSKGIKGFIMFIVLFIGGQWYFNLVFGGLGLINKENKEEYSELLKLSKNYRRRAIAFSIDGLIGYVFYFILIFMFAILGFNISMSANPLIEMAFTSLVLIFVQELIFCQTIGKKCLGFVILTKDFKRPNRIAIIIRNLSKFSLLFEVTGLIFVFSPIISINNRFLDDILAKTTVIPKGEFNKMNN